MFISCFLVLVCLVFLPAGVAHAYMDPGTISTLLHSVLASLVALGIALKLYWHRVLKFLGLRKHSGEAKSRDAQGYTRDGQHESSD